MGVTFPNESAEYRAARNKLLERDAALRREMEAVVAKIRALPPGGRLPRTTSSITLMPKERQRRYAVGTVPAEHRYASHLPLHVPSAP